MTGALIVAATPVSGLETAAGEFGGAEIVASETATVLEAAYTDFAASNFSAAKEKLDSLLEKGSLSGMERAAALELRANARAKLGDAAGAVEDIEAAIATGAFAPDHEAVLRDFAASMAPEESAAEI
jgi:hypothetical protein